MVYLFWGFLFTFVNAKVHPAGLTVGLIPDFVGFFLLWRGLVVLSSESRVFKKLTPVALVFLFVSLFMYVTDLFNVFSEDNMIMFAVGIVYTAARLFFCYFILRGIKDMEVKRNAEFYSAKLFRAWVAVFVFNICAMIPVSGLALVGALGILVVTAMFLVRMWDSMKNYKDCLEKNGPVTE